MPKMKTVLTEWEIAQEYAALVQRAEDNRSHSWQFVVEDQFGGSIQSLGVQRVAPNETTVACELPKI